MSRLRREKDRKIVYKSTLRGITKAEREQIRKHVEETKCPANVEALLMTIDELDRPIGAAVAERTRELQRTIDSLKSQNARMAARLEDLKDPEEAVKGVREILYRLVDLVSGHFTLSDVVGYDGPRNEFEADLMKLTIDARMALRGIK